MSTITKICRHFLQLSHWFRLLIKNDLSPLISSKKNAYIFQMPHLLPLLQPYKFVLNIALWCPVQWKSEINFSQEMCPSHIKKWMKRKIYIWSNKVMKSLIVFFVMGKTLPNIIQSLLVNNRRINLITNKTTFHDLQDIRTSTDPCTLAWSPGELLSKL